MASKSWKSAVTWSLPGLMSLLCVLTWGPAPAMARNADAVLYEVTEDMYLTVTVPSANGNIVSYVSDSSKAMNRQAVAQLSGFAKFGTPLCPIWVKQLAPKAEYCTVNVKGSDDLSLATGTGTLSGSYAVVVQDNNTVDAPEFVIITGTFTGDADLSPAMSGQAPLGFITKGVGTIDGYDGGAFTFTGTFRLPFALDASGRRGKPWRGADAYYLDGQSGPFPVKNNERSLGMPTVRLEIDFD